MPPKKKPRLRYESDLDLEISPSNSTATRDNQLIETVKKKGVAGFKELKKKDFFNPETIEVVAGKIIVKTAGQSYTFNTIEEVLKKGDTEKNLPWVLYLLYGCVCLFTSSAIRKDSTYERREGARNFILVMNGIVMNGIVRKRRLMGLLIYNLYASESTRQPSGIGLIGVVKNYKLSDIKKRSHDFRQTVAGSVASGLDSVLVEKHIDISDLDKIYVFWLPELIRRIMPFIDT